MCPTAYQFLTNRFHNKVQLWDLPGAGSLKFPLETYIQNMGICWFDVCIVIGDTRVREEEVALIQELERVLVPYLYVRTKMDRQAEDNLYETGKDVKQTMTEVKDSLTQVSGIKRPYLVGRDFIRGDASDAWENKDYQALQEDLRVMINNCADKQ
eukprot:TRINITY_DN18193_c0_g1_i3.p4 TRINITY_DN18193_c0_g1~~TRINITY_DN18193_c0_g1_i3.p4  ORF type:complete len:155 (-),score=8.47 TRINITY_DN18193_c0_g1_i3:196-660(-)